MRLFGLLFLFLILIVSCENENNNENKSPVKWTKKNSTDFGESVAFREEMNIKIYLKTRPEWNMKETGSGLRYWIYEANEGPRIQPGHTVDVSFEIRLLNDSLCYKSSDDELSTFLVDKSDVESGIQEGIKQLTLGDKAKFIIPSHLGHGLLGDLKKIPPLEILVIDIHVVDVR